MSVLELRGLSKSFGKFTAVDSISLSVDEGRIYGFLGPNGAGKTTTIKLISRISDADTGEIRLLGDLISSTSVGALNKLGVLFSEPAIFDLMTSLENLVYFGKLYGLTREEAERRAFILARMLDLDVESKKLVTDFSSGMKKKLGFLCALIHKPDLLVLDEPFESVDPSSSRMMKRILKDFAAAGGSVFISSHVLSHLEEIIDDLAIINKGEIVLSGDFASIQQDLAGLQQKSDLESIFLSSIGETEEKPVVFPW
ncbi:MAG: ABC transporter ATP-binding protein [Bacteroidetes bacterium]|nr:ABC transporter ATP-binding protein [Bacteroidota bacterium]